MRVVVVGGGGMRRCAGSADVRRAPHSHACPGGAAAGSNYPRELFDPHGFAASESFEAIAAAQQAAEDARAAVGAARTAVSFVSTGPQQVALFPPGTAPGLSAPPVSVSPLCPEYPNYAGRTYPPPLSNDSTVFTQVRSDGPSRKSRWD